jgi:hypothetical protein
VEIVEISEEDIDVFETLDENKDEHLSFKEVRFTNYIYIYINII